MSDRSKLVSAGEVTDFWGEWTARLHESHAGQMAPLGWIAVVYDVRHMVYSELYFDIYQ